MEKKDHWLFYLKLTPNLADDYVRLSQEFTKRNKSTIPISLSNLLECTKKMKTVHLLVTIKSVQEYEYFHKRAKKIIKYLVQTGKVHLYIASSFSPINNAIIMRRDHYHFVRLPVPYSDLCSSIARKIDIQESKATKWPGGTRVRREGIEL